MHKNEILYNFFNSQNIKYNNMVVINSYLLLYIYIYIYILEKIIIMIVLVYETIYFIITH